MEKWKRRSIDLLTALIFGGRDDLSVVPYYPQKLRVSGEEEGFFRRTIPERKGISSRRLFNMLCELESEGRANIHSIKVMSGSEVICECHAPGYEGDLWHISHSMAKTVCGMVIGRLWDEGKIDLDKPLCSFFPEIVYKDRKFPLITIDHLLSMTSGVEFGEAGSVTESGWTYSYFSSPVRFLPGKSFSYNSMNSYILARVAERICELPFGRLCEELIFAPMGIKNYLWEIGPEGTEKAGWGLYMSSESWAKLGVMLMSGGIFDGRRILSEEWIKLSSSVKAISPERSGGFNYAYQMWVSRSGGELLLSGMLGQNVWLCPKNNITVVMSGGNNELFQASPSLEIVRRYLGGRINDNLNLRDAITLYYKQKSFFEHRRWARPLDRGRGLVYLLGIKERDPFNPEWNEILGEYAFARNNVGILPLIVRAMQNNLASCIERMVIFRKDKLLYLTISESGEEYSFPVGLYAYAESRLRIRGEIYILRAIAEAYEGREGREYRIELLFPETASVRRLVIRKISDGKISLQMSETPGDRVAMDYLREYAKGNGAVGFTIDMLERRFGRGTVAKTIKKTFNPSLVGINTASKGYEKSLNDEQQRAIAEQNSTRLIRSIVDKLFGENS